MPPTTMHIEGMWIKAAPPPPEIMESEITKKPKSIPIIVAISMAY
jgi:hypothetical protein